MAKVRIQRFLADVGAASRRKVEQMILDGRITVNGRLVLELPCFVDPERDDIRVDSQPVPKRVAAKVYILLNKPRGVVCAQRDPRGRPRATDLLGPLGKRVYCVGQLDADSTGLVLLTNDGELTQSLTHPRLGLERSYVAEVDGRVEGPAVEGLQRGLFLDGRRTNPARVKVLRRGPQRTLIQINLVETHSRQVRRMLARFGHKVRRLKRTAFGHLTDKGLRIGRFRMLSPAEVARLRAQVEHGKPHRREDRNG